MKKIIVGYAVLVIAIIILALVQRGNLNLGIIGKKPTATINNNRLNLLLAKTDKEKMVGLSKRARLDKNTGMLFLFDKKDYYTFWMKNMRFPLDILFIDDDKIIDLFENVQPPKKGQNLSSLPIYKPKGKANYVLEINTGLSKKNNIKVGDKVVFENVK